MLILEHVELSCLFKSTLVCRKSSSHSFTLLTYAALTDVSDDRKVWIRLMS